MHFCFIYGTVFYIRFRYVPGNYGTGNLTRSFKKWSVYSRYNKNNKKNSKFLEMELMAENTRILLGRHFAAAPVVGA